MPKFLGHLVYKYTYIFILYTSYESIYTIHIKRYVCMIVHINISTATLRQKRRNTDNGKVNQIQIHKHTDFDEKLKTSKFGGNE